MLSPFLVGKIRQIFQNIYFFNVIFYYKAVAAILVAVHFLMQNIELTYDLGSALGRGYVI